MIELTRALPRILLLLGLVAASFSLAAWSGNSECDIAGIDSEAISLPGDIDDDC